VTGTSVSWRGCSVADDRVGRREGHAHLEHRPVVLVPDLEQWLDESIRIERV
jgi:hypothetical protein